MYRTILVPVDGSTLSEHAIPFAIEIARRAKGRVRLLRALPESLIVTDIPVSVQASTRKLAHAEVDRLVKAYNSAEVPVDAEVRIGFPLEEINRAATKADLVVMTTHGRGGVQRWVMGSVADKVIRLAATPVLVIHPPQKRTRAMAEASALRMFRDAMVSLDGSPLSAQALRELRQFAEGGTRIHLLRVVSHDASPASVDLAANQLKDAASDLVARGVNVVQAVAKSDSPAEAIVEYALQKGCGVIVMTTRGAGGIERWMLGGITDKVVRHGPTPVLVIRASRALWKGGKRPLGGRRNIRVI